MRLGIIGAGLIVREFLPMLAALEEVEVTAVMGRIEHRQQVEELCREQQIPHAVFTFEELLKTGIDTVYVAVPNALHFMYCEQALNARLNVIVEKPMVSNVSEAMRLRELAVANRCFLFEAITTVHFDAYKKIREWLQKIGSIKMIHCNYSQYSRRYDAFQEGITLTAFDPEQSGGALMDLNLYNLHFVMGCLVSRRKQYIMRILSGESIPAEP